MTLTEEQVEYIAELARLKLTDEEIPRYRQQLSSILDYFEQLQRVDTSEIPPTSAVLSASSKLRADEPQIGFTSDAFKHNAPDFHDGQIRIPPVFDRTPNKPTE